MAQDGDGVRIEVLRVGDASADLVVQLHIEGVISLFKPNPDSPGKLIAICCVHLI